MKKTIFHVDVNSAFLSWSAVKRLKEDPSAQDLREIPSVVGGDQATRHGIVTAKSVPAKKYHIQTGEPVAKALQKCPSLVIVSSDFSTYQKYSSEFIEILYRYTPVIEKASIDEAYMDVSELRGTYQDFSKCKSPFPLCLAKDISRTIHGELGFTVNIGISENKLLAKMASDFEKPDKIHTLYPDEIQQKMWPLPIQDLFGCGKKTALRLNNLGIRTIGEAAKMPLEILQSNLGNKAGEYIHNSAWGIGSDELSSEKREAKSYSNETTTPYDITIENYSREMPERLKRLSDKVAGRMKRDHCFASTISVIVKTSEFQKHSMQTKMPESVNDGNTIYKTAKELMDTLLLGTPGTNKSGTNSREGALLRQGAGIRLIGVRASGLDNGSYRQMTLFQIEENEKKEEEVKRQQSLERMVEDIESKFGKEAIHRGMLHKR